MKNIPLPSPNAGELSAPHVLESCLGYLELGMPREALHELDALPAEDAKLPVALHFRLIALMLLRKFGSVVRLARTGIERFPGMAEFYIHGGAALSAMRRARAARALWARAPHRLRQTGIFQLNVACCEAELGDMPRARFHLQCAMACDPGVAEVVEREPRLTGILAE